MFPHMWLRLCVLGACFVSQCGFLPAVRRFSGIPESVPRCPYRPQPAKRFCAPPRCTMADKAARRIAACPRTGRHRLRRHVRLGGLHCEFNKYSKPRFSFAIRVFAIRDFGRRPRRATGMHKRVRPTTTTQPAAAVKAVAAALYYCITTDFNRACVRSLNAARAALPARPRFRGRKRRNAHRCASPKHP